MKIQKTKTHITYELKLETLSPIHIGSGKIKNRFEYYIEKDKLGFLDYDKLGNYLEKDMGFINNYISYCSNQKDESKSLTKLLEKSPDKIKHVIDQDNKRAFDLSATNVRELSLMTGSPNIYLPASSFKGSLKTGIVGCLALKNKLNLVPNKQEFKKEVHYSLNNKNLLKNLIFHDSAIIPNEFIKIFGINIYTKSNTDNGDLWLECVIDSTQFNLVVTEKLDSKIHEQKAIFINRLEMADKFFREVWKFEKENARVHPNKSTIGTLYEDFYNNDVFEKAIKDKYLIRLGYGTSQLGTSLYIPYLEKNKNDRFLRIGAVYKNGKNAERKPYPYSIKNIYDEQTWPLGWVMIDKQKDAQ